MPGLAPPPSPSRTPPVDLLLILYIPLSLGAPCLSTLNIMRWEYHSLAFTAHSKKFPPFLSTFPPPPFIYSPVAAAYVLQYHLSMTVLVPSRPHRPLLALSSLRLSHPSIFEYNWGSQTELVHVN
jgi:hypothetical protein